MLDVALPSPSRFQESTPVVTNIGMPETGPSRRPVKRCRNMAELMEPTIPVQPRGQAPSLAGTTVQPIDPVPRHAETTNPLSCSCCHVLREFIHTNGRQYSKLEVHGRIGMICHAVYHQDAQGGSSTPQMFDFGKNNIDEIKHFLTSYCYNQNSLGYVLVPDPLSAYYEALCVGLEWTKTQNEPLGGSFPINAEPISTKGKGPEVVDSHNKGKGPAIVDSQVNDTYRLNLERRLRGESMSLQDLSRYFHLTLEETSAAIDLSTKTIQKICRREGVSDWPYKKLQKLMKYLSHLTTRLPQESPTSRVNTQEQIRWARAEMIRVCGGVVPLAYYLF